MASWRIKRRRFTHPNSETPKKASFAKRMTGGKRILLLHANGPRGKSPTFVRISDGGEGDCLGGDASSETITGVATGGPVANTAQVYR